jgi:hypothetical protein
MRQFRERLGLSQAEAAAALGVSQPFVCERDVTDLREIKELWVPLALRTLEHDFKRQQKIAMAERCPECGGAMFRAYYSVPPRHWLYGDLIDSYYCAGSRDTPHAKVRVGRLANGRLQRLDRFKNPITDQETELKRKRKRLTGYEIKYGIARCDKSSGRPGGCGGILTPQGTYRFHQGARYHLFRCWTPGCIFKNKRLNCLNGKCYEAGSLPNASRESSLPAAARTCIYCAGRTESRGSRMAPPNQIQLHCRASQCGKISYFDLRTRKCVPARAAGGKKPFDPHRTKCSKCGNLDMNRYQMKKDLLDRNPLRVPIPVRKKAALWNLPYKLSNEVLLVLYYCRHWKIYKMPNGIVIFKRSTKRRLRRGLTLKYVSSHSQGGRPTRPPIALQSSVN